MRKFSLGAMVITGVLSVAAPAMAAPAAVSYPAPTVEFGSVSSSIVIIGGTVNIFGGGFLPGATVVINNNSAPVGTAPANDQGKFVSAVTVNACGTNTLTGTGTGPSGHQRHVGHRTPEMRREALDLGQRGPRPLSDQVDERVTEAQGPRRACAHRANVILADGLSAS